MAGKNPIKFTDTTFRDGHQSLLATRMRTEDIIPFMERMDQMGYFAIEVWGGATFDTTHRFLGDDPWERIRTIKGILKKTPTMMLLRGQNLVGYRNYADDLTYRFVRYTAEAGVDIFRVFDALNDMRNWEVSVKALMDAKKEGLMAHFQAAVCYSLTQRRMGGPIFNLDYYVNFAKKSEDMGADSVVLKDMAGMCSPNDAYAIIKAMKETIKIPVEFHTHYTSRLRFHELPEGHRGRGGRPGHLPVPLCPAHLPAGHRAAAGGGGADRPGNRHGPGQARSRSARTWRRWR